MSELPNEYREKTAAVIGRRVKLLLKARKMTQRDLCAELGITPTTLCEQLSGRHTLRVDTVVRMCLALDCSADYLLGLSNTPRKNR